MQILKLKGFLFEPSDPAVYDRDSKTVLELCGKLGYKINELIDEYNRFYDEMLDKYQEAYDYMVTNLPLFVAEQLPAVASEVMQELYGTTLEQIVEDLGDLSSRMETAEGDIDNIEGNIEDIQEDISDLQTDLGNKIAEVYSNIKPFEGIAGLKANGTNLVPGMVVSTLYYDTEGDEGNASYMIVDSLESGEVADDETIIKITGVDLWAKLIPEDKVKTSCFSSVQHALDFAYANYKDLLVIGTNIVDDLVIPYDTNDTSHTIVIEGVDKVSSTLDLDGQILQVSGALERNFTFKNIGLHKRSNFDETIIDIENPNGPKNVFDNCLLSNCYLKLGDGTDPQDIKYMQGVYIKNTEFSSSNIEFDYLWKAVFENCTFGSSSTYYFQYPLHITQGSDITFNNCYFYDYQTALALKIEASQDIKFLNCEFQYLEATAVPVIFTNVDNSIMQNCIFASTNQQNCGIYIYGSANFSFDNVKFGVSTLMGSAVFYESCAYCHMDNISFASGSMAVSFYSCNCCTIKNYMGEYGYNIASASNGGNNIAYLNKEEDIDYFSGNGFTYIVPTANNFGDNTDMGNAEKYEGHVFFNTSDGTINYAHNNSWVPFGGSSGGGAEGYYYFNYSDMSTFDILSLSLTAEDEAKLILILTDAKTKNYPFILLNACNSVYESLYIIRINQINLSDATSRPIFWKIPAMNNMHNDLAYNGSNDAYSYSRLVVSCTNGEITSIALGQVNTTTHIRYLPTDNTNAYNPVNPYDPSTKKYVDETSYVDKTSSATINGATSVSSDPLLITKKGKLINIRGCLQPSASGLMSLVSVDLTEELSPAMFTSGVGYTMSYHTCLLYKSSTTEFETIECHITHTANDTKSTLIFSPLTSGGTSSVDTTMAIRFDITYIAKD